MKPMLAATVDDIADLRFPLYASPKLDGIRALILNGQVVSRNLKPIPNLHVQKLFSELAVGLDGELIVGDPTAKDCFRVTSSGVMSVEGEPLVSFYVFDGYFIRGSFDDRIKQVRRYVKTVGTNRVQPVTHVLIKDAFELYAYEQTMVDRGYEGVMLRDPRGLYKEGRSTMVEQGLMKLKKFADSEAEILGVVELMHNENEKTLNELGKAKRSSHKAGKVAGGTMGALTVRDVHTGVQFEIGAGFTAEDRKWFWNTRIKIAICPRIVKYKYFPTGSKDKPRFPVFLGFRDKGDMS